MVEAKIYAPEPAATDRPRTYNQLQARRSYTAGKRRVSMYVGWSFPAEANRDTTVLDNRFSTMTEVRRVEWPTWEPVQWSDPGLFQQGIAGGLELPAVTTVRPRRRPAAALPAPPR